MSPGADTQQPDNDVWRTTATDQWTYSATVKAPGFNQLLEAVESVTYSCALEISPEGIAVDTCDPSNVCGIIADVDCVDKAATGGLRAGVNVHALLNGLPAYHKTDPYYKITVEHGYGDDAEGDTFRVHNSEGEVEVEAFDPSQATSMGEFDDFEDGVDFELPTPKVRGVLGALADTRTGKLRLNPTDGALEVTAVTDTAEPTDEYQWTIDADIDGGEPVLYSTNYVSDIAKGMVPTGTTRVQFGAPGLLRIHQDEISFYLAPRIESGSRGDGDE